MYAFREMVDHMSMLRELFKRFLDLSPGIVGLEDCESLFAHLKNRQIFTEKFLVRHFLASREALETQEPGTVSWPPGLGNPAGG